MVNRYRKTGFITLFILILGMIWVCHLMIRDVLKGPHLVKVQFSNVGTLIQQDPVYMDGVKEIVEGGDTPLQMEIFQDIHIGQVVGIKYSKEAAVVTLELFKRIKIPEDSRFVNYNHSMMGERMVFVYYGKSQKWMDIDQVQQGIFMPGISEMLHKADTLVTMVNRYRSLVIDLKDGKDGSPGLSKDFRVVYLPALQNYLELIEEFQNLIKKTERGTEVANRQVRTVRDFVSKLNKGPNSIIQKTLQFSENFENRLVQLESVFKSIKDLSLKLNQPSNIMDPLLYEKKLLGKLKVVNNNLNALVDLLKAEGITDMVSFWKNVHILGTNPTKKNKR